jgi:hypothetical protein
VVSAAVASTTVTSTSQAGTAAIPAASRCGSQVTRMCSRIRNVWRARHPPSAAPAATVLAVAGDAVYDRRRTAAQRILMVSFSIQTAWVGVSPLAPPTGTWAILSTTDWPETTLPNTAYVLFQPALLLSLVLM